MPKSTKVMPGCPRQGSVFLRSCSLGPVLIVTRSPPNHGETLVRQRSTNGFFPIVQYSKWPLPRYALPHLRRTPSALRLLCCLPPWRRWACGATTQLRWQCVRACVRACVRSHPSLTQNETVFERRCAWHSTCAPPHDMSGFPKNPTCLKTVPNTSWIDAGPIKEMPSEDSEILTKLVFD